MIVITSPRLPFPAHPLRFRDRLASRLVPNLICIFPALHNLQTQSLRDVKGNVAVNEPGARVVGSEGYDNVASLGYENDVATRWVDAIAGNAWRVTVVPRRSRLFEEGEVVAVKMNLGGIESVR